MPRGPETWERWRDLGLLAVVIVAACDPPRPTREEAQATLDGLDELHSAGEDLMWFSHASCDARTGDVRLSLGERSANAYDLESLAFATDLVAADLLEEITQEPYCVEGIENPPYSRCQRWGRMGRYSPSDSVRCSGYQVRIVVAELGPPRVRSLEFPDDATTVIVYERRTVVDEVVGGIISRHRSRFQGRVPTATDGRAGRVRLVRSDDGWRVRDIL